MGPTMISSNVNIEDVLKKMTTMMTSMLFNDSETMINAVG